MRVSINIVAIVFTFLTLSSSAVAGPIAWGLCQTACNAGYVVCCTAAGVVAGMSHLFSVTIYGLILHATG